MKRITIKEIAQQAQVSVGTVDRVLHNRGEVAAATRSKVLEIAKEGNYQVNVVARNLKLNKVYKLAIVIPQDNEYWKDQKKGMEKALDEYSSFGLKATFYTVNRQVHNGLSEAVDLALKKEPDGMVLAPLEKDNFGLLHALANKVPFVLIDASVQDVKPLATIAQNSFNAGVLAAKLLHFGWQNNRKAIILRTMGTDGLNKTIDERMEGFKSYYDNMGWDRSLVVEKLCAVEQGGMVKPCKLEANNLYFVPNSRANEYVSFFSNTDTYRMVGFDLTNSNHFQLKKDSIDFIIDQAPEEQGYLSIQCFYKYWISKVEIEPIHEMPLQIFTKENLQG